MLKVIVAEDMGDDSFPFVDTIFVCTSASDQDLMQEFESLSPDDIFDPHEESLDILPDAHDDQKWRAVWWD